MSFRTSSFAILVAIAAITLALVTAASFTHYSAFAVSKKDDSSSSTTTKATSTTSAATNSNSLTSKELKSFINCVTTANKAQGLTHKVVRSCLDTALGIPAASGAGTAAAAAGAGASSAGSSTSDTTG
jgi:homoserine kinase